jgi:hypothetical protein
MAFLLEKVRGRGTQNQRADRYSVAAFPKLKFLESGLKFRGFARLKAGRSKTSRTARVCPETVRVSVQLIGFGTDSVFNILNNVGGGE